MRSETTRRAKEGNIIAPVDPVQCIRLPQNRSSSQRGWTTAVYEVQNCLAQIACDRARDAVNEAFDAGRTTDRGVSLPTQDVMVSSLPQECQDDIRSALQTAADRVSRELPGVTLEFAMSRAFCIVYDAKRQRGLKKHTDGRKEGATLLLLLSRPQRDFTGGGTRFFPGILESSFDAKPNAGSTIVFPSDTLQHEGLPIKRGRRLLVCVFATKKLIQHTPANRTSDDAQHVEEQQDDNTIVCNQDTIDDTDEPTHSKCIDAIPPDTASLRGKAGYDDQSLAQECVCTIC
uniref:Fe2OG dioxygenase domain-containing protein n=1 Tax=Aureoumbra lagunensis TaxID=44058 RepID=A0A7S3JSR6_9STRA|mmetsp:Transcript_4309/g.6094  ORF Transcript_4309/g.6094 Transcript_4309/m.6094 type:complete len:289 (+) Transcript_4309:330-1196(+)|eukprot:CAMPEP_0197291078 /NCGR_PEP_ID=MMETSP0890-20130614/11635_1 /TAXON_ID=44058 ORGANISM="Aureoumbra lagunensis, Strain CCMP1510" /NCGR_SAMPLE_ID=MMETSP0890 /ASSEMBLY_ACC=CAM_ASM_000533 /LENGTH=288 /DNA_ID=CAMNT_0042763623 /DNA_START=325 /DNA_END=1191 /DNA_ORIENTATION=+